MSNFTSLLRLYIEDVNKEVFMKVKKIIVSLMVMVLVFGNIGISQAVSIPKEDIGVLWDDGNTIHSDIFNNGNRISLSARILAKINSDSISGTMYLERYSNGRWVTDAAWSFRGTGRANLSKSYTGSYGNTYRVIVNASIGGESISKTSSSIRL